MTKVSQTMPHRRIACGSCGTVFDCGRGGKSGGCWCMDESARLPMPEPNGGDCLCPNCLRTAAASSPG